MKLTILIDHQVCDLYEGTSLSIANTAFEVGDPILRTSTFTYSFKLPLTVRNKAIFKNIQNLPIKDKFLMGFTAQVLADTDTIVTGTCLINSLTKEEISLNIISNNLDWIKRFESRTLQDLPDTFSFPFTSIWGTDNSMGELLDGNRFQDYVGADLDNQKDMGFPLISYGNFFQPTIARVWSLEGVTPTTILPSGNYVTDDSIPFYINSIGELRPTATFEDGKVLVIGGNKYQVVVDRPKPDEYIGTTDFVTEDFTPSFRYKRVLQECFKQAGLKVVCPLFNDSETVRDLVLPYVGDGFKWNYGTLGRFKSENLTLPKTTPSTYTRLIDDVQDNVTLPSFEIFTPLGNQVGTYRDTIGGEPCYTSGPQISLYDNYKDGAWVVEEKPLIAPWWCQMFYINNPMDENFSTWYDFSNNYRKYTGLNVQNNLPEGVYNVGNYYRAPEKGTYRVNVQLEMSIVGYPWNPANQSRKFTGEHLPLLLCVIKNEDFENSVKWLYQEYLGIPNTQGTDENILYRRDLVGNDNILFSDSGTSISFDEMFDLEKEDTVTVCFFYFQQSSRFDADVAPRGTGLHLYALAKIDEATITIDPQLNEEIRVKDNVPAVSQSEFVKEFIKLYNLYPRIVGDTVYLEPFNFLQTDIDLSYRASIVSIDNPGIKDKLYWEYAEDASDTWYLTKKGTTEETIYVPIADYVKDFKTGNTEYKFNTFFSATKSRDYTVVTDATPEGTRALPTMASKKDIESDPRFTDWSYAFNQRLLRYRGEYDMYLWMYGEPIRVGEADFPDRLQMGSIYNLGYKRIINTINGSSEVEIEAYLTARELKLITESIAQVKYEGGEYIVTASTTDIKTGKSKLTLIKL